jgi:hypothetical protein
MELTRLTAPLAQLGDVASHVSAHANMVVLECSDADTIMAAATLSGELDRPIGVWLEITSGYTAAICARDLATLSWLIDVEHVVVAAREKSQSHADVVEALLTNDEVNITNDVAVIAHAYNRPAPPKPITVWNFDGTAVRRGVTELIESSGARFAEITLTTFS